MIRLTSKKDGLYYLENQSGRVRVENSSPTSFLSKSVMSNKDKVWLYHSCLGHPSFEVLESMFPSFIKGC